jgi:hypothetical protein
MAKYKVNKKTNILKSNPNKKDMFGDVGTDVVGTLQIGDIIDIAKTGGGGRGIVMTPYLIFSDDTFILGYDADKVDDSTPASKTNSNLLLKPIGNINMTSEDRLYEKLGIKFTNSGWGLKSRPMGRLLVLGVLIASYFAYKKFNK